MSNRYDDDFIVVEHEEDRVWESLGEHPSNRRGDPWDGHCSVR